MRFSIVAKAAVALLSTGSVLLPGAAAAGVPIVDFNPSQVGGSLLPVPPGHFVGFEEAHTAGVIGWSFTSNQPLTITQAGLWDQNGDGLSRAFQLGLWTSQSFDGTFPGNGNLLGSDGITVPGGTSASLNGIYRAVDLAQPLALRPGNYVLGLLDTATTTDPIEFEFTGESNSQVTIGSPTIDGAFVALQGLEVGPMLFEVPEPSAKVLLPLLLIAAVTPPRRFARPAA